MPITPEEYRRRFPDRPDPIPLDYAGKWVAITHNRHTIVASGDNPIRVRRQAQLEGHDNVILKFVPSAAYIGRV